MEIVSRQIYLNAVQGLKFLQAPQICRLLHTPRLWSPSGLPLFSNYSELLLQVCAVYCVCTHGYMYLL